MAKENVAKFFEALKKDKSLEAKMSALAETYYTGIAALAKESGFDITAGEVKDALTGDAQLGEDALSSVAGGSVSLKPRWREFSDVPITVGDIMRKKRYGK